MPIGPKTLKFTPGGSAAIAAVTAAVIALAVVALALGVGTSSAAPDAKVWICKYVHKPGGGEELKPGKNPLNVSSNATVGTVFKDGQEMSYVVAAVTDENADNPPSCPATPPGTPATTTTTTTAGTTPTTTAGAGSSSSTSTLPASAPTGAVSPWFDHGALWSVVGLALLALAGSLHLAGRRSRSSH